MRIEELIIDGFKRCVLRADGLPAAH